MATNNISGKPLKSNLNCTKETVIYAADASFKLDGFENTTRIYNTRSLHDRLQANLFRFPG